MQFIIAILTMLSCSFILQFIFCEDKPLILTPLIESGKFNEAKRLSRVPKNRILCETEGYSGFLTVNKQFNSNLFFWFFKSQIQNAPILLWLQGGPGSSSLNALFNMNGPFQITKNLKLKCRKYAWTKSFSMLYIDNPIGVGFSFTKSDSGYSKNLENVTENLYLALKQFFTLFSELKFNDFYGTGQSYAGKYLPALANKIHTSNETILNLKGIAVGNNFIDPISLLSYGPHLYQTGLIDEKQQNIFDEKEKEIQLSIKNEDYRSAYNKLDKLISKMLFTGESLFESLTGYSYYYDLRCTTSPLGNRSNLIEFLNLPSTRKAIHVGNIPYILGGDNNIPVLKPMIDDIMRSEKNSFKVIIDNYKVLLYAGNMDLLLPAVLSHQFLKTLDWKNRDNYLNASREIWKVSSNDKEIAGYVKKANTFYEVIVRNAGHMVIIDQPRAAFDMITKFVNDRF